MSVKSHAGEMDIVVMKNNPETIMIRQSTIWRAHSISGFVCDRVFKQLLRHFTASPDDSSNLITVLMSSSLSLQDASMLEGLKCLGMIRFLRQSLSQSSWSFVVNLSISPNPAALHM